MKNCTTPYKPRLLLKAALTGFAIALAGGFSAQAVTLTASDASNTTSFNTAGKWDDLLAPSAGKTYSTGAFILRTPTTSASFTFAGDSLSIDSGGRFLGKVATSGAQTITIANLILNGGVFDQATSNSASASTVLTVAGGINVVAASTLGALGRAANGLTTDTAGFETLDITATISGSAALTIAGTANNGLATGVVKLSAANSYSGTITVSTPTNGFVASATNRLLQLNHVNALQNATLTLSSVANGVSFATAANTGTFNVGALAGTANQALTDTAGGAVTLNVGSNSADTAYSGILSGAGALIKSGNGTLTLSGANAYTGNTTISAGTLVLSSTASSKFVIGAAGVNTRIAGTGILIVDGQFDIDVSGAATTLGTTWQIVDTSTLTETFGGTFAVTSFAANGGGTWIKPANGAFYEFNQNTGVLRVVTDPGLALPPPTVSLGNHATTYVSGSTITLHVNATGTGTLGYQWYRQETAGDTPVAISGATSSSYSIADASASSGGIYSVTVTEVTSQPPSSTTATFPLISVVPVNDVVVAYYRFEEGTPGAAVSGAADSSASAANALTAGANTAVFSSDVALPQIPATSAANTRAADFGTANINSLVASTGGGLAGTEFASFTVEAFVKFNTLTGFSTFVGRDDSGSPGQGVTATALFYLQRSSATMRVELIDRSNVTLVATGSANTVVDRWYHVAVVGDVNAGTLSLYVDGQLVGSITGFTGLYVPTTGSDTPWTVGRGDYNAADTDAMRGLIDEVRITRAALPNTRFLNSNGSAVITPPTVSVAPAAITVRTGDGASYTATAASQMGGTLSYQWYKGGAPIAGQTSPTLALTGVTTAADGTYSVIVTDSAGVGLGTPVTAESSAILRVIDAPAASRAISLNFVGASTGGNYSTVLGTFAAADSAGFVPVVNWNNSATATGVFTQTTPLTLIENTGASSPASAIWESANTWAARTATGDPMTAKTGDFRLLHGYIETRAAAGASVTISNIPYASYDVYVYVAGGTSGTIGKTAIDRVGSPTYYYRLSQHDAYTVTTAPTTMIGLSTDATTAATAPTATFVRFASVSGSDLTITTSDNTLNANAGGIAAIEIVDRTPVGTPYPPTVTIAPTSLLKVGGSSASFTVAATSNNSGGVLSYQWQKDSVNLGGQTSATLNLSGLTGSSSGTYNVVVTDTSSLGTSTTTKSASLVVVDSSRSLLINGDINTATSPTYVGDGILRANGTLDYTNLETNPTVWNGIIGAAGTATRVLAKESTGLSLSGITFTYTDATGAEDDTTSGGGVVDPAAELERDYLYAAFTSSTPLTGSVGGLQAFAGKQVTLLVYAIGKTAKSGTAVNSATVNDTANVSLTPVNNYLNSPTGRTSVYGIGGADDAGRNIEFNNPIYNGGLATSYVAFDGVVAADGTVSWSLTPDTSGLGGGLVPLVGFQLLVTGTDIAPPVPTSLAAVAGNNQVSLTWTASSGAQTYTIKRATSAAGPYTIISQGVVTGTSHTDTTATNGSTYYYVVAANNSLAQSADSTPVSVTLGGGATALENWRQLKFGSPANSGTGADSADPDADGRANLLEYALGTEPLSADAGPPATLGRSGNFLTLAFNHIGDATLVYTIEATNDLVSTWGIVQTYSSLSTAGTTTYTDSVSLVTQPRRFLRVRVTTP